jgi:hypothetical protein
MKCVAKLLPLFCIVFRVVNFRQIKLTKVSVLIFYWVCTRDYFPILVRLVQRNVKIVVVMLDESLITNRTCDKGDPKVNWEDINIQFIVPRGTTTFDPIVKNAPIESLQWLMLETDVQGMVIPYILLTEKITMHENILQGVTKNDNFAIQ